MRDAIGTCTVSHLTGNEPNQKSYHTVLKTKKAIQLYKNGLYIKKSVPIINAII